MVFSKMANQDKTIATPSIEQWRILYDLAINIKRQAPWKTLWDRDIITIILPDADEPFYCSIMGKNEECYAIGVYLGYEGFMSYLRLASDTENTPPFILGFEQKCLMCYYGDREEVLSEDREIYKALDIKFRGRNEWIYFRSMDPGFYPWHINSEQADLMIKVFQQLTIVFDQISDGSIKANFDDDDTIMRSFSQTENKWVSNVMEMPPISMEMQYLIFSNELLVASLKKRKKNNQQLELGLIYMPMPVKENKNDRPYMPQFLLMVDKKSGLIIDQHLIDLNESVENVIIGMLVHFIETYGRPAQIFVRDELTSRYIHDFCEKIKIKLTLDYNLDTMYSVLLELLDSFN